MFPIYEISAAPHLPQPLKPAASLIPASESVASNASDFDSIAYRDEILVAITAS
jgi:hypothetical protein